MRTIIKKRKKGQLFSIDALVSFGIFLIIIIMVFFMWNYSLNKTKENSIKQQTDYVSYIISENLLKNHLNNSINSVLNVNRTVCKQYGMYKSTMRCFVEVCLENKSKYLMGEIENTHKFSSTITRLISLENQSAIFIVGVSDE